MSPRALVYLFFFSITITAASICTLASEEAREQRRTNSTDRVTNNSNDHSMGHVERGCRGHEISTSGIAKAGFRSAAKSGNHVSSHTTSFYPPWEPAAPAALFQIKENPLTQPIFADACLQPTPSPDNPSAPHRPSITPIREPCFQESQPAQPLEARGRFARAPPSRTRRRGHYDGDGPEAAAVAGVSLGAFLILIVSARGHGPPGR
jgi:hypothetical protein